MKKRILSWLLVFALLAGLAPIGAMAAEVPAGSGGQEDPYEVATDQESTVPDESEEPDPGTDEPDPTPPVDRTALMDAIAAKLSTSSDGWAALDMALYAALEDKSVATTPEARQEALDLLIAQAANGKATVSDRARLELVLRAMGVDSTRLYAEGDGAPTDNAQALSQMDLTSGGHYAAPWVLLAAQQGNLKLTQAQTGSLLELLKDHLGDGLFSYEYDGVTYPDPDTACAALAALAPLYETDAEAKAMADQILAALPGALDDNGSLGCANSDAFAVIGLVAMGVDPEELKHAGGPSVVDGLLSYVNQTQDGFVYAGVDNALATEQGFRALIALARFKGEPCNIYDFSAQTVQPGQATGSKPSAPSTPSTQPGVSGGQTRIKVTLTLRVNKSNWIDGEALELSRGNTVYHALKQALTANGMTAQGLESGYIQSVTKDDVTLAEFDYGPNSGWLYQVNGAAPDVPFNACALADGDSVLWYYAADWPQSSGSTGSGGAKKEKEEKTEEKKEEPAPDQSVFSFLDVAQGDWYYASVKSVCDAGLMTGVDQTHFAPDQTTSRAMVATLLWRMADSPAAQGTGGFSDVAAGAWYTNAVTWASRTGVVRGYDDGRFGPDDPITREQLTLMLYRYAQAAGREVPAQVALGAFADAKQVSGYARTSMAWAVGVGLVRGKDGGRLDPAGTATRAEAAAVLERLKLWWDAPQPQTDPALDKAIEKTAARLVRSVAEPQVGDVGGEWLILALARGGCDVPEGYYDRYLAAVTDALVDREGVLSGTKNTEYSRLALALSALGVDARQVAGYDLTAPLDNYDKTMRQGVNGAIWALIALDSRDYPAAQATRQRYVDEIVSRALPGGGWSLRGSGEVEPDLTGMALQALASYREQAAVAQAVEDALAAMSARQDAQGGFTSWGETSAESCVQMVMALNTLGVSLDDPRFVKNGRTLLDRLMDFSCAEGGFAHTAGGDYDGMTSEQALCALVSTRRMTGGKTALYDCSDLPPIAP